MNQHVALVNLTMLFSLSDMDPVLLETIGL